MTRVTLASTELVEFPDYGDISTLAKVDTGAWTCSLHCEDIHEAGGVLSFRPLTREAIVQQTTNYEVKTIVSSNGTSEDRYLVMMKIRLQGVEYETEVTLADRTPMSRDMLIGRKFMKDNNMLVDVMLESEDYEESMAKEQ